MTLVILAAVLAAFAALALGRLRRTPEHPDLPGLADVLTLARRERGPFGIRWRRAILALRLSGVPLNVMINEQWPTLLIPGLRKTFHERMRAREELFKRTIVFPVDTSQKEKEQYQGIGELGTGMWNEFEKTGRTSYDEFEPTWKTDLEHREFTGGIQVRRKLIDDNLYPGSGIPTQITGRVTKLADSAAIHREKSAADVFNNAFTDSGTDSAGFSVAGADGVGLGSTAHKHSATDTATQTNEGTLALTKANLATTALLMREFTDNRGELVAMKPDLILVPPELEDTALEIVGSALDPTSANNTINAQRGRYSVLGWDYLTDATAWFLIDSMLRDQHLVWLDRILPEFANEFDADTQVVKYPAYHRFSRGWDAWQWVFCQNG